MSGQFRLNTANFTTLTDILFTVLFNIKDMHLDI